MRKIISLPFLICLYAAGVMGAVPVHVASPACSDIDQMYAGFRQVPDSVRTKIWWFHGEDRTTREGITADLEGFKAAGLQGVVYYDQQHGKGTEHSLKAMSQEWWDMLKFSAQEAKRLGLSFDINISNGYCCGGSWITPELGMQCVRSTETIIKGGEHFKGKLPEVGKRALEDIAVLAFPVKSGYHESRVCLPEKITVTEPGTIPLASFKEPFTARSLSYNMVGWSKAAQSIVNIPCDPQDEFCGDRFTWQPPIGELEVSDDSITWRKAATLHSIYLLRSLSPDFTISFPAATGRYFRLNLHDWTPSNGGWMVIDGEWKKVEEMKGEGKKEEIPLTIKSLTLSAQARTDRWEEHAACFTEYIRPSQTPEFTGYEIIAKERLLNITQYMNAEGVLDWTAPKGTDWKVVRFTNCHTGGASKHGRPNLLGPETDKLSAHAAEVHWQHYPQQILDTLRAIGCPVQSVCMDSHEAGSQNWTHDMPQLFREKYGYDIQPWLPAMQGYIVGSVKETEQFLQDLRRCIANGINDRYIATLQRLCTENGVEFTCQAMGNGQSICSDNLAAKGRVDRPQGEFWTRHHEGSYDTREAASAAHIWGKTIASAEAFTDYEYNDMFCSVKDEIDMETAMQVNEFVICASAHQPWLEPAKIQTAYNREYAFNRKNTLWPFARPFFDYQARNHYMMRQGKPVVDLLVYAGDEAPVKMLAHRLPEIPEGYDFDVCTTDGLMQAFSTPLPLLRGGSGWGSPRYQALCIEKSAVVRPETEQFIAALKAKGLTVYDNRTQGDDELGKVLAEAGLRPDVGIKSKRTALDRVFTTHRQTSEADIYYFTNHSRENTFDDFVTLRTGYSHAEYWDAITGLRYHIPAERTADGLKLRLSLLPLESGFIVAHNAAGDALPPLLQRMGTEHAVTGPWTITFDRTLGGPEQPVVTDSLFDFTTSSNEKIKYFSGLATYENTFRLPKNFSPNIHSSLSSGEGRGGTLSLRLPGLKGVARVWVNDKEAGTIWCTPWEVDITPFVKRGKNTLKIEVRNSLANRLIGDAGLPEAERNTWTFTQLYKATSRPVPSGITGEVFIISR